MKSGINSKLEGVTYTRAYKSDREMSIMLVGASRWLMDIELLLEDEWKYLALGSERNELYNMIVGRDPKIFIIETAPFGESELRLIESVLPRNSVRYIVGQSTYSDLPWQKLQRSMAPHGIGSILLSEDPIKAASELSEILVDLVILARTLPNDDHAKIQAAYSGYLLSSSNIPSIGPAIDSSAVKSVLNILMAKFALSYSQIEAGLILGGTFQMYVRARDSGTTIAATYQRIERTLEGGPVMKLLNLASKWERGLAHNNLPSLEQWQIWIDDEKVGSQARLALLNTYMQVVQLVSQKEIQKTG